MAAAREENAGGGGIPDHWTLAGIALNMGAGSKARRIPMAKGQIRSNREKKKPKQAKEKPTGATAQFSVAQPKPVNTSLGKK
jgi:hypothetical protein